MLVERLYLPYITLPLTLWHAVKTYLSSHHLSTVVIGGTPGPHGDPGLPGESQVNHIILSETFTNISLQFPMFKSCFIFTFGPYGDFFFSISKKSAWS